jgi:hypothetical protein
MFGFGMAELIIVVLIILGIFIVPVVLGKKLKVGKPAKYPAYSIAWGWLMIVILVLTLIFSQSGHVLTFTSVTLRLIVAVLLGRAYYLIHKQRNYVQTLWLLVTALLLWFPVLWQWSIRSPTHSHSLMLNNPGYLAGTMLGGSFFIWKPIWYLLKRPTKERYAKLEVGEDTKNRTEISKPY